MKQTQVRKTTLFNGVRVITEFMPFVRSVSMGIWIRSGSVNESIHNNGISHFLEHMLFKGTSKRSAIDIASSLESLGGSLNGSTGKEYSTLTAHVLDEHLPIAVDVLSDMIQDPLMQESDLELEKQVVLAEISHSREDPEEMIADYLYQNMYPGHSLGYFIYGREENIIKFSRQELLNYLKSEYSNDRIIYAAAGRVDHSKFVDLVSRNFHVRNTSAHNGDNIPITKNPIPVFRQHIKSLYQSHICMGARTVGFNDPKKYPLAILDVLLGGGMSSRLFQNIREKYGFAYNVYSFTDFLQDTGIFGIYMACANDKVDVSIDILNKEIDKIRKGHVREEELALIKSQIKGAIILGMESSARRMRKIAETEIYLGAHLNVDDIISRIDQVTKRDLIDIANEFLTENQFSTSLLTPK
jgi:predicted Zn-dependent peptidase